MLPRRWKSYRGREMSAALRLRFVRNREELAEELLVAKQRRCPHCGRLGTINGHGFLRGYSEDGVAGSLRGRRFYCSNRGRRPGCGRTFSVLMHQCLAGFLVRTPTLACFVLAVVAGGALCVAWTRAAQGRFSRSSGYRLWARFCGAVSHLRSALFGRGAPKDSAHESAVGQLLSELSRWAPDAAGDVLAGFQSSFQRRLFP